jgi:hypothetical protein
MTTATLAPIHSLLVDSLTLWKIRGAVSSTESPAVVAIHADDGTEIRVEPASEIERPIRWWVRWRAAEKTVTGLRSRPCTSTIGLLRTVREALGADGGLTLQIAPASGQV